MCVIVKIIVGDGYLEADILSAASLDGNLPTQYRCMYGGNLRKEIESKHHDAH